MRCYLTLLLIVAATPCLSGEQQGRKAEVNIRQIDGPIDHNHCTTRQFQHMSFCHKGTWFVFYSDGRDFRYQTSIDGGTSWDAAEQPVAPAPNGSSSHDVLQVGNTVYLAHAFDPTQNRLHLTYVDRENKLRYRCLDSPYRRSDWQPGLSQPGLELASGVFTCALSVDSSSMPYGLVITYGLEKHVGKDKRQRTGELYARQFDGQEWREEPILVSRPGTIHNWYPNVNQDVRAGLCVLYSRSEDREHLGIPLAVMVSVGRF